MSAKLEEEIRRVWEQKKPQRLAPEDVRRIWEERKPQGIAPQDVLYPSPLGVPDVNTAPEGDPWSDLPSPLSPPSWPGRLRVLVCKEWNYCEKRVQLGEGVDLAIAIGDCLTAAATQIPFPIASTAVYLVKNRILDKLCNCDQGQPDNTGELSQELWIERDQ
jgi:hypothetical protein